MNQYVQMLRIDTFGSRPKVVKDKDGTPYTKRSFMGVLMEGGREIGNAPHVLSPTEPTLLYGMAPRELAGELAHDFRNARDKRGQRLHPDTQILLGGFASYPIPPGEMWDIPGAESTYFEWEDKFLEYLKAKWGNRLRSVVRHGDEERLHVHFYVTPDLAAGETNLDALHPAMGAVAAAVPKNLRTKEAIKQRRNAWTPALRLLLDEFYEQVSVRFGHARIGPDPNERLPQKQMQRRRQREKAAAVAEEEAKRIRAAAERIQAEALEKCARTTAECDAMRAAVSDEIRVGRLALTTLLDRLQIAIKCAEELHLKVPTDVTDVFSEALNFLQDSGPGSGI